MKVTVEHTDSFTKEIELEEGSRIQDVLDRFQIKYDFVITMLNGKPSPIDEKLMDSDVLKVITVVSGG